MGAGAVILANRLPKFVGCARDPRKLLARARIGLIGLGSVGLALATHLARMGIGTLCLVDRGVLKPESVLTHPIPAGVAGRPKAEHAAEVVRDLAPDLRVLVHQAAFEDLPLDLLEGDMVVLATDNLNAEVAVGQRCMNLGIPLLQASVLGSLLVAQLRVFTWGEHGEGPCPACLFNEAEWAQVSSESHHPCDGSTPEHGRSGPTLSTSSLCSLAAELAAHRVLRHLLGLGAPLTDQILEYRGYTDELVTTSLSRNPDCPMEHHRWAIRPRGDARTVGEVSRGEACSVSVDRALFVDQAACGSGTWHTVRRFVPLGESVGPCVHCGGPLQPSPFHSLSAVSAESGFASVPIPPGHAVVLREPNGGVTLLTTTRQS